MIHFLKGDLFSTRVEVLVNPVNCVGVMGRGLALEFKERFPDNFQVYKRACDHGKIKPGSLYTLPVNESIVIPSYRLRFIVNFPTKDHWRDPSRLEWIDSGLMELSRMIELNHVQSIAIPAIGCGLGGLKWGDVKALMIKHLSVNESTHIFIYEPD